MPASTAAPSASSEAALPAGAAAEVSAIRTLALVGPAGAGKTSLVEALLAAAGAIGAPGSLERGTMTTDFDPMERRAGHSLASALVHLNHAGTRIHVIDTPGTPDFLGQSLPALEAVETAAVVIGASGATRGGEDGAGIEPMAVRMMAYAAARERCRLVVVNRIDAPGADLAALVRQIQAEFGRECLPLNLPADGGTRVVDCFFDPGDAGGGNAPAVDFSSVAEAHRALVEQVVEVDAGFVERYLEEGDVDPRELHAPLEQALREGHLIPICFVSARNGAGVAELLDVIARLLPNPAEGNPPAFLKGEGQDAMPFETRPDPALHVVAHAFKVTQDPYVGKMGILRVHQGTLEQGIQLYVGDGRRPFRVGHLFMLQGKAHVEVPRALPGDLCAVAKVEELHYDAVLHDAAEDDHLHLAPLDLPVPVHGLAIEPKRRGDEQRLWDLLQKCADEDPCLRIEHVAAGNETVLYGLGELHLRTVIERLAETHRCEVATRPPRIAYRETITAKAEGHHRHKKQSGGAGQFGEVYLRVEPLPATGGEGPQQPAFEFVDEVKGGVIPGQFMPAVEKGVRQAVASGVIAGYPMQGVRVTVYDGKSHSVDSKEIAFVTAGRKAFVDAVKKARPIVLEPVVKVEITAPEGAIGDITGDLSSRRGQVSGTRGAQPGYLTVMAEVPQSELESYQSRLHALTGGSGRYTVAPSRYEAVPPAVQQQLVAQYAGREED